MHPVPLTGIETKSSDAVHPHRQGMHPVPLAGIETTQSGPQDILNGVMHPVPLTGIETANQRTNISHRSCACIPYPSRGLRLSFYAFASLPSIMHPVPLTGIETGCRRRRCKHTGHASRTPHASFQATKIAPSTFWRELFCLFVAFGGNREKTCFEKAKGQERGTYQINAEVYPLSRTI